MVSQGAQTNGMLVNGRKLMKSYSEASRFGTNTYIPDLQNLDLTIEHEPLQRTQSDEPPRSPFIVTSPPAIQLESIIPTSDTSSLTRSDDRESEDSEEKCQKEIFIDFKPQMPLGQIRKPLMKTQSEGEILMDQRKALLNGDAIMHEKTLSSLSHENIMTEEAPRIFTPYFTNTPIRHEGIFRDINQRVFSSISDSFDEPGLIPQDSIDEEFHERLIYGGMYLRREGSITSEADAVDGEQRVRKSETSPDDESVVPSFSLLLDRKLSPFASSDSLANDMRCVLAI